MIRQKHSPLPSLKVCRPVMRVGAAIPVKLQDASVLAPEPAPLTRIFTDGWLYSRSVQLHRLIVGIRETAQWSRSYLFNVMFQRNEMRAM